MEAAFAAGLQAAQDAVLGFIAYGLPVVAVVAAAGYAVRFLWRAISSPVIGFGEAPAWKQEKWADEGRRGFMD